MPQNWGADSLQNLNASVQGTNLANYVINVQYKPDQIVFWGRYFAYGANENADFGALGDEIPDFRAAIAQNGPSPYSCFILPISSPSSENATEADGVNDANYVIGHIINSLGPNFRMPGDGTLYVFLDIEPGEATNTAWLGGWVRTVNGYSYANSAPFFASAYVSPSDSTNISNLEDVGGIYKSWSPQPEAGSGLGCGACDSPGPSWGPQSIGNFGTPLVWQYAEADSYCQSCRGQTIYVDLDLSDPSLPAPRGACDEMLYIPPG
jgi:hypothetical protein